VGHFSIRSHAEGGVLYITLYLVTSEDLHALTVHHSPHSTSHSPQSTLHSPRPTVHSPQSIVHSPRPTVHNPQPQSTTVYCSPSTVYWSQSTVYCSPSIVYCSPSTVYCSPSTVYVLFPVHSLLFPVHSLLFPVHSLCTVPNPQSTVYISGQSTQSTVHYPESTTHRLFTSSLGDLRIKVRDAILFYERSLVLVIRKLVGICICSP
jgi:hypothetical protein